jgi:TnpA family transposase
MPGDERVPDTRGSSFDFRFLLGLHSTDRPRYAGDKCVRAFAKNERGDSRSMQYDLGDDFEGDDSKGC